jgi:3-oxoacyl-[acyl-carrier-protein] synthase-1
MRRPSAVVKRPSGAFSRVDARIERLAISGFGMVSPVGRSAPASCAAIRAGIARPRRVSYFQALDEEKQEEVPVTGYPVRGYTEGFNMVGRWLRLARGAVQDLLGLSGLQEEKDSRFWQKTGLITVAPRPNDARFQNEGGEGETALREAFLAPLYNAIGLPLSQRNLHAMGVGHAGTAMAVQRSLEWVVREGLERVLIVAVDSYLDPLTLQWLAASRRLKTEAVPTGLSPGEAGVCLLLETPPSAAQRGVAAPVLVSGVATGQEANSFLSRKPNTGVALASCIQEALDQALPQQGFAGDVYSDLNGETWRAMEWGSALVRLAGRVAEPRLHLPCVSVGDVGAASGALATCLAVHELSRGHVRTNHALVVSSSDGGEVGCLSLQLAPR